MSQRECGRCGAKSKSTVICEGCSKTLRKAFEHIGDYYPDLNTLRTRQTRYGAGSGGRSVGKTMPLGIDARFASDGAGTVAEKLTRQAVVAWSTRVRSELRTAQGPVCDGTCLHRSCALLRRGQDSPGRTVSSACEYLVRQLRYIVGREYVVEMLDVMLDLEKRLRRLVDRPAERYYAGACGSETDLLDDDDQVVGVQLCERPLYAVPGRPSVKCPACGCEYDVEARRGDLLVEAEDRLATVESIVRIVTTLGDVRVDSAKISARIRKWASRGKLTSHGERVVDGRKRPTYRVGDVLDLLAESSKEKTA